MCEAQERTISVGISLEGNDAKGKRVRRTVVIGNVDQYPTQDLALAAVNGFTVSINEACNRQANDPFSLAIWWTIIYRPSIA